MKETAVRIKYSFIKILHTSDLSRRRLPFMSLESVNRGPTVFLTACAHGDEVSGMVIVQEIFKIARKLLTMGSIHAFPLLNPIGFETSSRYITISEEDLNRSFPGNPNGSLAERIADKIFSTIVQSNPSIVIDLHNDWIKSIPYAFLDHAPNIINSEAYKKSKDFVQKTGLLPILDTGKIENSLSYSLINRGTPAITLELGEAYVINENNVEYGVKVILNILEHLGMIAPSEKFFVYLPTEELRGRLLYYTSQASSLSGIVRFMAKSGDIVKKGQPIAKIFNAFGWHKETIAAKNNGIVLGHSDYSVAYPGAEIMSFGTFEETNPIINA
jgi:predicted deacylase